MISKEDRMYFIDPLQPSSVAKTKLDGSELPLQVLALRFRRDAFKADRIGSIVNVTHQRVDNNELWWVDADGDYVYGAQLADRHRGRGNLMAIINDDLFIVGRNGGEHHLGSSSHGSIISEARRSDGRRPMGVTGNMMYTAPLVLKAAPWAHDLMPVPGDNADVVTAKVARAKQMFIQRHKKGEIYKEGMRRDWLHHLETLREDHDMPTPVFNVGVEGTFLTTSSDDVAVDSLTPAQRDRIEPLDRNSIVRPDGRLRDGFVHSFVGKPFALVTTLTASDMAGMMSVSTSDIKYAVFDRLRTHSGYVLETNRFPILTSF